MVSDKGSGSILKFTPSGVKSTFANGVVPICFAFDTAGNLSVSDRNSASILKFAADGTKTVFVSGGTRNENAGAEPVSNEEAFRKSLEYTRAVVEKQHMICFVDIDSLNGGQKTSFRYDHYPEVERIQMKNGDTFARKKDQPWLRSDDWAETGSKVNSNKSDELDSLAEYPSVALDDEGSTTMTQGAVVVRLIKREEVEDTDAFIMKKAEKNKPGSTIRNSFSRRPKKEPDEKALLAGWAGLMRSDTERFHVNMNFSFLFRLTCRKQQREPVKPLAQRRRKPAAPTPTGGVPAAESLTEDAQIVSDNLAYSRDYYSGVHFVAIASCQAHSPTIVTQTIAKSAFAAMREHLLANIQGSPG